MKLKRQLWRRNQISVGDILWTYVDARSIEEKEYIRKMGCIFGNKYESECWRDFKYRMSIHPFFLIWGDNEC